MNNARQERGEAIAKVAVLAKRADGSWAVPSMSGNGKYTVRIDSASPTCTCPDCAENGYKCKHIFAVETVMQRETTTHADGSVTVTETVAIRKTYAQDWPNYNAAQTNEKDHFKELLFDLCRNIQTPAPKSRKGGRPTLPMSDAIFAAVFKVYSTFSGRRFMCDLSDAKDQGYIAKVPHFNSIFNYLENPEVTPILEKMIVESSKPLAAVEQDFAGDSSGFATCRFVRWFDHKYGEVKMKHDWVKCHIMCGVKTNVVTAVYIGDRAAADTKQAPALLATTAENFTMREVSLDKGYSSINNANEIEKYGATPFIVFKSGATGTGSKGAEKRDRGAWEKMFHYFSFKKDEFMDHYHKRSNAESTFHMVKSKTGDSVRSKTDVAMKNEAMCKFLCHNICCLISAMYELGIEPELAMGS